MTSPQSRRVVDTNVISYIFKNDTGQNDTRGPLYVPHLQGHNLIMSVQSLAELEVWALRANWGARRKAELHAFLAAYVLIYPDERIVTQYAFARYESLKVGITIDPADAWIAATALALRCPLVTHNAADFAGVPHLTIITETRP